MAAHPTKTDFYQNGLELHDFVGVSTCDICYDPLLTPANTPPPVSSAAVAEAKARVLAAMAKEGIIEKGTVRESKTEDADSGECGIQSKRPGDDNAQEICSTAQQHGIRYYQHTCVKITACGHLFGVTCLGRWIMTRQTCPMCRKELFPYPTMADSKKALELTKPISAELADELTTLNRYVPKEFLQNTTLNELIIQGLDEQVQYLREELVIAFATLDLYQELAALNARMVQMRETHVLGPQDSIDLRVRYLLVLRLVDQESGADAMLRRIVQGEHTGDESEESDEIAESMNMDEDRADSDQQMPDPGGEERRTEYWQR